MHDPILETRRQQWPAEADCQVFAAALALRPALRNAFISLQGPLGAGKTTLVRYLLRALGVSGRIKSPTFAVLEPYEVDGLVISHFDFYRFSDPREWADAGFRELFAQPGLKLAEWPENVAGMLPTPDLEVALMPLDDDSRELQLTARTAIGLTLLP